MLRTIPGLICTHKLLKSHRKNEAILYLSISHPIPVRVKIELDTLSGTWQSDTTDQQDSHQDVRTRSREVHNLDK